MVDNLLQFEMVKMTQRKVPESWMEHHVLYLRFRCDRFKCAADICFHSTDSSYSACRLAVLTWNIKWIRLAKIHTAVARGFLRWKFGDVVWEIKKRLKWMEKIKCDSVIFEWIRHRHIKQNIKMWLCADSSNTTNRFPVNLPLWTK